MLDAKTEFPNYINIRDGAISFISFQSDPSIPLGFDSTLDSTSIFNLSRNVFEILHTDNNCTWNNSQEGKRSTITEEVSFFVVRQGNKDKFLRRDFDR